MSAEDRNYNVRVEFSDGTAGVTYTDTAGVKCDGDGALRILQRHKVWRFSYTTTLAYHPPDEWSTATCSEA